VALSEEPPLFGRFTHWWRTGCSRLDT